jgi:hypothetical protein
MTYFSQQSSGRATFRPSSMPPFPQDPTTATRHLCAGAYLDDAFRNDCLRQVYHQPRRLVAPSYGFDLVPVLAHCLRARNGAIIRDAAIVVTFLVAVCVSPAAVLFVLSGMASLQVFVGTYRLARDTIRRLRNGEPISLGTLVPGIFLLALGCALTAVLWLVTSTYLAKSTADALWSGSVSGAQSALMVATFAGLLLALLIFLYPVVFSLWRQAELARLSPGSRLTQPVRNTRLDEIALQQRGNTAVYSGFRPYVGSGLLIDTWGFAQRLVRPAPPFARELDALRGGDDRPAPTEQQREFAESPFDAQELVDYVRGHLAALLPSREGEKQREAEEQIAGLTVEDRVLLAGTEVSYLAPHTAPEVMAAVIRHPTTPARHYLACQVFAWGGELITTVYVHIAVQGRSLYLELTTTALPPCTEGYRIVDTVEGNGAMAWLRAVKTGVVDTPRTIWRAPAGLVAAVLNLIASAGTGADPNRLTRGYDYGARVGVREMGSDLEMRNLTQVQDVAKYRKLISRRVIASVLDFLDDRGVDTTEYRAHAATVLSGVNTIAENVTYNAPVAGRDMSGPAAKP